MWGVAGVYGACRGRVAGTRAGASAELPEPVQDPAQQFRGRRDLRASVPGRSGPGLRFALRPRLGQSRRRQSPLRQSRLRQPGRRQRRYRRCDFCPGPGSGWPADGQCGARVHRGRRPRRQRSYRIRYRRDGGSGWAQGAQARLEEFAHAFDRLVQRQAALPGQILGGQRAVDSAGDGPRPGSQRPKLHKHATDIAFWLITAAQHILPFAGRLKGTGQTGREVRNPGRSRERDLTSIKVDSPLRVAIDLQNPGGLLEGQALQNLGDLWPR